jgi:hypothetical protein
VLREQLAEHDIFTLLRSRQLDPEAFDAILGELERVLPSWLAPLAISRDAYPYLEYSTPAGYAYGDEREENNLRWIARFAPRDAPQIAGVPPQQARRIAALITRR